MAGFAFVMFPLAKQLPGPDKIEFDVEATPADGVAGSA
jgi:hypothetical protein